MRVTMTNAPTSGDIEQLDALMTEAFGIKFRPWFERGLWDERYERYAIMDGGRMRATIGAYRMALRIGGERIDAVQIGGVATTKDARGQGCQRALFEQLFASHPGVPMFLHANDSVTGFYPKFGFVRAWEHAPTVAVRIDNRIERIRVDCDDRGLRAAIEGRGPLSAVLDCADTGPVQLFNALGSEAICHLPALGAYIVARQHGERLMLSDVISERPIPFDALCAHMPFSGVTTVEFGFTPDLMGVDPEWTRIDSDDEALFVRGALPLPDRFRMPATSMT